jgi:nucleotide-binding universal stress UspA family protein
MSGALATAFGCWYVANDRYEVGADPTLAAGLAGAVRPPRLPLRPRRIIAAVDFTPAGERARTVAVELARASEAVLDLVHVLDAFDHIFMRRRPELVAEPQAVLDGIDVALESRASSARRHGVRCVWTSLVGAPGLELGRHATRTGADLLAIGAPVNGKDFAPGWGARALEQLLALPGWRGVVLRVPALPFDDEPGDAPTHSTRAVLISGIQWPVKPRVA